MPQMTEHVFSTFSWVDVSSTDTDGAKAFYGSLFGWEFADITAADMMGENLAPDLPGETVMYTMCSLRGKLVCGLAGTMSPDMPTVWNAYVNVEDADAVVTRAKALGGSADMGVMDIADSGRMAFITDPNGGMCGIWQARNHQGMEVQGEPDTFTWAEHNTRDVDAATGFYGTLFDWEGGSNPEAPDYTLFHRAGTDAGDQVAGLREMDPRWPSEIPPTWVVHFRVADLDAKVQSVKDLGGSVMTEPEPFPFGRFCWAMDPQQGAFIIVELNV